MPSSRPSKPRCSVVVALTDTRSSSTPIAPAIARRMASMRPQPGLLGADRAVHVPDLVALFLAAVPPRGAAGSSSRCPQNRPTCRESAARCRPAPRPAGRRTGAWIATSPSEWATHPFVWAISTPPRTSGRPSARACTSYPCPILKSIRSRILYCQKLRIFS